MDRFNDVAAKILEDLYENFPAPHYPTPNSTGLTEENPEFVGGRENTSEEYRELAKELRGALLWLVDEGYVLDRGYKIGPSHVLTGDGLKALQKIAPDYKLPTFIL